MSLTPSDGHLAAGPVQPGIQSHHISSQVLMKHGSSSGSSGQNQTRGVYALEPAMAFPVEEPVGPSHGSRKLGNQSWQAAGQWVAPDFGVGSGARSTGSWMKASAGKQADALGDGFDQMGHWSGGCSVGWSYEGPNHDHGYDAQDCYEPQDGVETLRSAEKRRELSPGHCCFCKFLVPFHCAGRFIGKSGGTISEIESSSGCELQISGPDKYFPGTQDRICIVGGPNVQCLSAAMLGIVDVLRRALSENNVKSSDCATSASRLIFKLVIPKSAASKIIGPKGESLQKLTAKLGCRISLSPRMEDFQERLLVISGEHLALRTATVQIAETLQNDSHLQEHMTLTYTQKKPLGFWSGESNDPADPECPLMSPEEAKYKSKRQLVTYLRGAAPRDVLAKLKMLGDIKNCIKNTSQPSLLAVVEELWISREGPYLQPSRPVETQEAPSPEPRPRQPGPLQQDEPVPPGPLGPQLLPAADAPEPTEPMEPGEPTEPTAPMEPLEPMEPMEPTSPNALLQSEPFLETQSMQGIDSDAESVEEASLHIRTLKVELEKLESTEPSNLNSQTSQQAEPSEPRDQPEEGPPERSESHGDDHAMELLESEESTEPDENLMESFHLAVDMIADCVLGHHEAPPEYGSEVTEELIAHCPVALKDLRYEKLPKKEDDLHFVTADLLNGAPPCIEVPKAPGVSSCGQPSEAEAAVLKVKYKSFLCGPDEDKALAKNEKPMLSLKDPGFAAPQNHHQSLASPPELAQEPKVKPVGC